MDKNLWIYVFFLGIILFLISFIIIQWKNSIISGFTWILFYSSLIIIIIAFGLYIFSGNTKLKKYNFYCYEENWKKNVVI
ncbi:unnamed protein product [marine sediment metagenome]|uniref:Uncharacterized protein n=1 Tax=marine sediment metagenome TaxID=412755 RepID=X1TXR3_9ZZZZ